MALCPTCGQARGGKQGHGKFGTDQAVPDWSNRPELDSNDGAGGLVGRDPIDTKVKQFSSSLYNYTPDIIIHLSLCLHQSALSSTPQRLQPFIPPLHLLALSCFAAAAAAAGLTSSSPLSAGAQEVAARDGAINRLYQNALASVVKTPTHRQ